jgi:PAS domain S-box-containing protein
MPKKKSEKRTPFRKASKAKTAKPKKLAKKNAASKKKPVSFNESGKRLNLALQAAKMGVWDYDLKTNLVEWSDNVHHLFGISTSSFDGTLETFINIIHPDDKPSVIEMIKDTIATKNNTLVEYRVIWPDGSVHWIETNSKAIVGPKGKVVRITGTVQDVSQKKIIEYEREDWKTRHELVSKSAGLVIYDYMIASGEIIWSGNSENVLGYKPEELGNIDKWASLIHPDDRDEAFTQLEIADRDLKPYDVVYRFSKKNGGYCYMHDRGFFLPDKKGKAFRMLGMMNDVSERIVNEQIIQENNHFRESIENAMPDILYVHDLVHQRNIYTNKNLPKLLGYSLRELKAMGDSFVMNIVHPDDLSKVYQWTKEPEGFVHEMELRVRTKSGNYCWIYTRDTPFRWDKEGNVTQIIGVAQDITSRKSFMSQVHESEESYRQLFDTVSEAIYIQSTDGKFVDVNKSACKLFGYTKEEIVGQTPLFLAADGKNNFDEINARIQHAFAGHPQSMEFWGKKKNGEVFIQEIHLSKGKYFGKDIIIATGRDATERRRTEQALRDSEQRFRTLQQASFGGIGLHSKGTIIDCNQGLCDITGYSYQELIGFNGLLLIAPEWRDFVLEKIMSSYEKPYDVEGVRKDGTRYVLEIHGKNIPYENTTIRVTEFRDITERKRTEEKVIEQNAKLLALTEDLLRKNNQLEEFTQIVSHNLRSPVGNIVTLLNFLDGSITDSERDEFLKLLKESSATTLTMLNDLNDVLKIKQNKNIEKQEVSFEAVLLLTKSMLNAKITQMGAEITYDFKEVPSIPYPTIYMESIVLNLLDNALKYAHPDRHPKVDFKTYYNNEGHTVMEIKDNGLGLNTQKYGHQVFKLRKTFHRHPESRGIGLFMIKNQIEAMGGEIIMESKENEGSTFFINFNKTQADAR